MRIDAAIEMTQIGHHIMQISVVMLDKRTLPGIINIRNHSTPPVPGFLVVGHIYRTKTIILCREPANITQRVQDKGYNINKRYNAHNLTVP
jgi:hypothetical protein